MSHHQIVICTQCKAVIIPVYELCDKCKMEKKSSITKEWAQQAAEESSNLEIKLLDEAAQSLLAHLLRLVPDVSVGIGANGLVVYSKEKSDNVPSEWEGFPVLYRVIGSVRPA